MNAIDFSLKALVSCKVGRDPHPCSTHSVSWDQKSVQKAWQGILQDTAPPNTPLAHSFAKLPVLDLLMGRSSLTSKTLHLYWFLCLECPFRCQPGQLLSTIGTKRGYFPLQKPSPPTESREPPLNALKPFACFYHSAALRV